MTNEFNFATGLISLTINHYAFPLPPACQCNTSGWHKHYPSRETPFHIRPIYHRAPAFRHGVLLETGWVIPFHPRPSSLVTLAWTHPPRSDQLNPRPCAARGMCICFLDNALRSALNSRPNNALYQKSRAFVGNLTFEPILTSNFMTVIR